MFDSQMQEAATHRIVIKHAIVDQFREFYQIMLPLVGCKVVISSTSIDNLLTLSDYYQVQSLEVIVGVISRRRRHRRRRRRRRRRQNLKSGRNPARILPESCQHPAILSKSF